MDSSHSHSYGSGVSSVCDPSEKQSSMLSEATHFMTELVGSYDADKLCAASLHLAGIIKKADTSCVQLLIEKDVVGVIMKMMDNLSSHPAAQEAGCDVLMSCNEFVDFRSILEDHQAYRQVMKVLQNHKENSEVIAKALDTISSLALSALNETTYKESKVYRDVLQVLKIHTEDSSVLSSGFLAMSTLLEMDPFAASHMAMCGDFSLFLTAVKKHSSQFGVVSCAFRSLRCIVKQCLHFEKLQELRNSVEYICEVLERNQSHEDVVSASFGLLEALSLAELQATDEPNTQSHLDMISLGTFRSDATVQSYLKQPWVLQLISEILETFITVAEVLVLGFKILYSLFAITKLEVSRSMQVWWLKLIHMSMEFHKESTDVNEGSCYLLSALLIVYPDLHVYIGDKEDQFPLYNHLWMILLTLSYNPNVTLFIVASTVFYYMVECDDTLQQLLLKKGASVVLMECLRGYLTDKITNVDCVECGCRALKGILMHQCSDGQKNYLMDVGIFSDLQIILDKFFQTPRVITEALCIIACLSDLRRFQVMVIEHALLKVILENVEGHISDEIIVEIALEIFIVMSLNEEMVQYLTDSELLGITVTMMKKHITCPAIQFKGCMLIRLLFEFSLHSDELCIGIAKAVIDALSRKMDRKVQCEALACTQVLCKCSQQMAQCFVKGDIHILLFTLLYKDEKQNEIMAPSVEVTEGNEAKVENFFFEVGTDIIYTLSCIYNFMQEMLTTTVKDGLLEGIRVLIGIGVDINIGKLGELPICLAVESENVETVKVLLYHGISNANIKAALAMSQNKSLDQITGLLLEYIAVDRSREIVTLTGLELNILKPLWILPCLGFKIEEARSKKHKREGSLGHLKKNILHRKSIASDTLCSYSVGKSSNKQDSNLRRSSIDISALTFLRSSKSRSEDEVSINSSTVASLKYCSSESAHLTMKIEYPEIEIVEDKYPDVSERTGNIVPKGSFRKQVHGAISGAKSLPRSQLDQYTVEYTDGSSFSSLKNSHNFGEYMISPMQLCRQLRRLQKKPNQSVIIGHHYTSLDQIVSVPRNILELPDNLSTSLFSDSGTHDFRDATNEVQESEVTRNKLASRETKSGTTEENYSKCNNPKEILSTSRLLSANTNEEANEEHEEIFHGYTNAVKVLDLSSNHLQNLHHLDYLPYGGIFLFKHLKEVRKFDIKQNVLTELPSAMMREMVHLSVLLLSCNKFSCFPLNAICSENLAEIDISSNQITDIPPLPPMKNLLRFNVRHNKLTTMPSCISQCSKYASFPSLIHFDLRNNQISNIPNCHVKLNNLEVLYLAKNKLQVLPDEFLANLQSLKSLDISMNEISQMGGLIGQDMVYLEELKVAHNKLYLCEATFNTFITSAPVLQAIDATGNGLSSIPPPYAWKCLAIRDIRYGQNNIVKLDLSECKRFWSRLEFLHISSNKLKKIPEEIGQLRSLCCLDISSNKDIKSLPDQMGDLDHLFMLNLEGLKHLNLDPSLVSASAKTIVAYLKSRSTESVPCYRMKLMVVGAANKGKTTLLSHIVHSPGTISINKSNLATLGVNVKPWVYQHKQPDGSFLTFNISCWDFAGQEEFYSTHQCFLSQRSLYIVVYNLSNGESELHYLQPWLHNIQARAPSSLVIIVGTHLDQLRLSEKYVDKWRISMRTKLKGILHQPGFPSDVSFAEVDCFNDRNMNDLRTKLKGLIDSAKLRGQKIMGGLIPATYIHLENLIINEKRKMERMKCKFPVLRESRLYQLMEEAQLSTKMDRLEVQQAIKFLHECGVLLHYNDLQTKLSELYFLDPEWLCALMAQIITLKQISFINEKGIIDIKILPLILKEPKFPSKYISEYIRLLERFDVVLKHRDGKLLVPSRLPKIKPPAVQLVKNREELCRRYSFSYIPPGFLPRLIARVIAFPHFLPNLDSSNFVIPCSPDLWSTGIYMFWSQIVDRSNAKYCKIQLQNYKESYIHLEVLPDNESTIDIRVPLSSTGKRLLCAAVDNIEALVDEWYPGLRDISVMDGSHQIQQVAVCPHCLDQSPHCFPLNTLIVQAYSNDEVECPIHKGKVKLEELAPDIVVGDVATNFKLCFDEIHLDENPQNILGKGGFADVYKANYHDKIVAVKVFSHGVASMSNTTPNQLVRQEVNILSKLYHPHIIGFIGVCTKPKSILVLEYADLGSLNSMKPYRSFSTQLKHKVAIQIASALAYLHRNEIIYRDLKPGNILMFSMSCLDKVNAKLSDYGIACYSTPAGLTQSIGTPGYRAPELLLSSSCNMPYYDKVDVYSYGLMMFELITEGHKPFEELNAGFEIDKFIAEGRPINNIDQYGCSSWPDMQDLINHCLQYVPVQRPSMKSVFERLCTSEFLALKKSFPVERNLRVETFTARTFSRLSGSNNLEIWAISTLSSRTMLSIFDYNSHNKNVGKILPENRRIISMAAVESNLVLMGSSDGDVLVYDGMEKTYMHALKSGGSSILILVYFKCPTKVSSFLAAGLASGEVIFYHQEVLRTPHGEGQVIKLGSGPVRDIKRYQSKLYVICGNKIIILNGSKFEIEKSWQLMDGTTSYLSSIEVGSTFIWTALHESSQIHVWDREDISCTKVIHCDRIVNSIILHSSDTVSPFDARVLSMQLQQHPNSVLWLGLGSGHILLLNSLSMRPVMATKRHVHSVCCIQIIDTTLNDKPIRHILSSGYGFLERPGSKAPKKGTPETYGSILAWDTIMPKLKANYDEIKCDLNTFL